MSDEQLSGPGFLEDESDEEIDEDFLYHLYQGGDLLRTDRVVEAKDHLEKAFTLKPANPRGQNLLGLVYFKLGLYHRAIEIYKGLVERYKEDATLRVNLAMVYLKADQLDESEHELQRAIELSPDHKSAHRYLGLVLARKNLPDQAREHFLLAGVKSIDHLLGVDAEDEGTQKRQDEIEKAQRRALAEVADQGFRELEEKEIPFRDAGPGTSRPPGDARGPDSDLDRSGPGEEASGQADVGRWQDEHWSAREAGREAVAGTDSSEELFSLDGGALIVRVPGVVFCRLDNLTWAEGAFNYSQVHKRFGGQDTRHPFDRGRRAMIKVEGDGLLRMNPPSEQTFEILEHAGEPGYYLEESVVAFSESPAWENGRLPSGQGSDLPIFHLFGACRLVLRRSGRLIRRKLDGESVFRLRLDHLLGWVGNMVPRLFEGEFPFPDDMWIELTGAGEVLYQD